MGDSQRYGKVSMVEGCCTSRSDGVGGWNHGMTVQQQGKHVRQSISRHVCTTQQSMLVLTYASDAREAGPHTWQE